MQVVDRNDHRKKPTTKGTFTCQVAVTDAESPPQSATVALSITVTENHRADT